ncbi:universal stress protein [Ectothiorhodospiraceae bacterium WFHF3C12]|nr:universal stress protein [Ectothiorhodospiraceae bacterium WFHF3C12]
MASDERILVAVDDSPEAKRTVDLVARVVGAGFNARISLYHRLPPLPPSLRERGGSEDPEGEERLRQEENSQIEAWLRGVEAHAQRLLHSYQHQLIEAGVPEQRIESRIDRDVSSDEPLTRALRRMASKHECRTIALARGYLNAIEDLFHRHTSDTLVRAGQGVALWVVE